MNTYFLYSLCYFLNFYTIKNLFNQKGDIMIYKNIVTSDWLLNHLNDPNVMIVDCRFQLGKPHAGLETYHKEHIPGAIYLHLEKDLSAPISKHGGRHPLPSPQHFASTLGKNGIDSSKTVIAYDDQNGAMASRLWWMLKYVGHKNVYVLNINFFKWKESDLPTTNVVPYYEETI